MRPVVILAGGLGTRLRSVVKELPKPLAPVAGKPFLWWLLRSLESQGATDVYLSTGYKADLISNNFGDSFGRLRLTYVTEDEPLGTGGAILRAAALVDAPDFFVLNGDTLAVIDLAAMERAAAGSATDVVMSVVRVPDATRYGTISFEQDGRVTEFKSKGAPGPGYISAGVYILKKDTLLNAVLPEKFSIEQDFFEKKLAELDIRALDCVRNFIDIGVPVDYELAQQVIPAWVTAE